MRQALILSKSYSTPVPYWLGLTLPELKTYIYEHNLLVHEQEEEYARMREEG